MGPDEFATRQELNLVFRLLLAKIQQHAELMSGLTADLTAKGIISPEEFQAILAQAAESPIAAKAKRAAENLKEFLTIHNIDQLFQDTPEE
jgi:hypothetical protein